METCEICGGYAEKHHIIYKSQGGLDFDLNYKWLCYDHHRTGSLAPHQNEGINKLYKKEFQEKLEEIFPNDYVTEEELKVLGIKKKDIEKITKKFRIINGSYEKTEVIKRLCGGRFYL